MATCPTTLDARHFVATWHFSAYRYAEMPSHEIIQIYFKTRAESVILPSIDSVWSRDLSFIDHMSAGIGDETEAPGSLGLGILHNDDVDDFSPFAEMRLQGIVGGPVVQTTDEKFAHVLWFILKIISMLIGSQEWRRKSRVLERWRRATIITTNASKHEL